MTFDLDDAGAATPAPAMRRRSRGRRRAATRRRCDGDAAAIRAAVDAGPNPRPRRAHQRGPGRGAARGARDPASIRSHRSVTRAALVPRACCGSRGGCSARACAGARSRTKNRSSWRVRRSRCCASTARPSIPGAELSLAVTVIGLWNDRARGGRSRARRRQGPKPGAGGLTSWRRISCSWCSGRKGSGKEHAGARVIRVRSRRDPRLHRRAAQVNARDRGLRGVRARAGREREAPRFRLSLRVVDTDEALRVLSVATSCRARCWWSKRRASTARRSRCRSRWRGSSASAGTARSARSRRAAAEHAAPRHHRPT